jgi:hypothetical protein
MHRPGSIVALGLGLFFILALVLNLSGVVARATPPAPQTLIAVLTLVMLGLSLGLPSLRRWADTVSPRILVAVHLTRFVGIYFLVLSGRGALASAFAIPAGWGDIFVATTAVALLLTTSPDTRKGRQLYFIWNILGAVDILLVIITAARVGLTDPASMQPLLHLPLSLLPAFLVPVINVSHILLFRRLRSEV